MNYKHLLLSLALLANAASYTVAPSQDLTLDDFIPLISETEIQERIAAVAAQIDYDYEGEEIVIIMVMKGSVCVAADMMRALTIPCALEYVRTSSYGQNGMQPGALAVSSLENLDIAGKHVLLIDDIFDTGNTLCQLETLLLEKNPASLKMLVLLTKRKQRAMQRTPDYVLFEIENQFVIGYGLDYKELYRGLPAVYVKK